MNAIRINFITFPGTDIISNIHVVNIHPSDSLDVKISRDGDFVDSLLIKPDQINEYPHYTDMPKTVVELLDHIGKDKLALYMMGNMK